MLHLTDSSLIMILVDWDKYTSYRPKYPPSLEKLIMDYHRAHSNSLRMAHDVGSGSGVFAPTLAEYFQHVHVSDPKPAFIVQARQRLDQWFAEHWWKSRFTFSVTAAENADEVAAKRSVDLVTLMQCVHWTDQDRTVESVAASLAPNGTMAIVAYNPAPAVVGNELTNQAVRQLFAFWADNIIDAAGGKESMLAMKFIPQENSGVESILLPDGLFIQDVTKRIEINITGRGEAPHALPGHEHLMGLSRANPLHRRYEYSSEEREGGRLEV